MSEPLHTYCGESMLEPHQKDADGGPRMAARPFKRGEAIHAGHWWMSQWFRPVIEKEPIYEREPDQQPERS